MQNRKAPTKQGLILSAIIFVLCFSVSAQKSVFSLQNQADRIIGIEQIFSQNSQIYPFNDASPICGLAITGNAVFNSDSSLIRVILIDNRFNEYLVFESYPLLVDSTRFSFSQFGEETGLLQELIPSSIRIEIVDASINLAELVTSELSMQKSGIAQADLRRQQMLERIDKINNNLGESKIPWIAGETSLSRMSYEEKKTHFGGKIPNLRGFEYYSGGIFITPGGLKAAEEKEFNSISGESVESPYVKEFSWRNVHGRDWVTSVKNQTGCNSCWAFGAIGAVEQMVNLYFNQTINYDLSEQHVISCTDGDCILGAPQSLALEYAQNSGIVMEECFPYSASEQECAEVCDNPQERIRIDSFSHFQKEDEKKRAILSGATSVTVNQWQHVLQVVGYKTLEEGDTLYLKNDSDTCQWTVIGEESPLRNQTTWLCKNSWGKNWGNQGYVYLLSDEQDITMFSLHGPVSSLIYRDEDIVCSDQDGDGYYSWGNGPKPSHCPDSPPEPDGDDTKRCVGPRDVYGKFTSTTPVPEAQDTVIIDGQEVPDLFASGENVRWYSDKKLLNPVHQGNLFSTGLEDFGDYALYATQTVSGCESTANEVKLSIWPEVPRPIGHDTLIKHGEAARLTVHGKPGAMFKWYADSLLTNFLFTGEVYDTPRLDTGTYNYYVTQTICQNESAADLVVLRIKELVYIPDYTFLQALIKEGVDTNQDGRISYQEAEEVTNLRVIRGISDMTGIEAFIHLDTLRCTENFITHLDVSNCQALRYLDCSDNRLINLDVSGLESLVYLKCSGYTLISLNASGCIGLEYLYCNSNLLTNLNIGGCNALQHLEISFNKLTHLDLSSHPALMYLNCRSSQLTTLNVSGCESLQQIDCHSSQLTSLDVRGCLSLQQLDCSRNPLSTLDVSDCTSLQDLNCSRGQLEQVDVSNCPNLMYINCQDNLLVGLDLTDCIALQTLYCSNNQLIGLDLSGHATLQYVNCSFNQLRSLEVSNCPALEILYSTENLLVSLDVSNSAKLNRIYCSNNQLTNLNASGCRALTALNCKENQLSSLELSHCTSLVWLMCNDNNLNHMDLESCTALEALYCANNQFHSLAFPESLDLILLDCYGNQLESLDISTCPSLSYLNCGGNLLKRLDISQNPEIGNRDGDYPELSIADMSTLNEVCVWTTPFPPAGVIVDTTGSPNIEFKECSNDVEDNDPDEFNVYPNPSSGLFTIETDLEEDYHIAVLSPDGFCIYEESFHGKQHQLDLSSFPQGLYFITIRYKSSFTREKVIKL